ncbi:MAG: TlpA family protein disulfide reductase [Pyrinomonadaceae bacterium]
MRKIIYRMETLKTFFSVLALVQILSFAAFAQTAKEKKPAEKPTQSEVKNAKPETSETVNLPIVTQIDGDALGKLLKPNGKPVLINFWATWCGPCVEEFPELVKINSDYREKLDVKAISLDDLAEINRDVPKFLAKVKSEIPVYLLKTSDEDKAIQSVNKSWQGGLPFTILINADGTVAYTRQGAINPKILRGEIDKILLK